MILQQLRDAEDEINFGEYAGREGDLVAGVIQQGKDPRVVLVDLGKIEAMLPPASRCPARTTSTASGSAATWCRSRRATAARR